MPITCCLVYIIKNIQVCRPILCTHAHWTLTQSMCCGKSEQKHCLQVSHAYAISLYLQWRMIWIPLPSPGMLLPKMWASNSVWLNRLWNGTWRCWRWLVMWSHVHILHLFSKYEQLTLPRLILQQQLFHVWCGCQCFYSLYNSEICGV